MLIYSDENELTPELGSSSGRLYVICAHFAEMLNSWIIQVKL